MASSTIGIFYRVTKQAKKIFAKEEHVLIEVDKIGSNEPVNLYFNRGATSIVGEEIFNREKYAGAMDAAAINEIDMQYEKKLTEMNPVFGNIKKYQMQNFIYNPAGMFAIALGKDSFSYKPRFSNGKLCHIWKENINEKDHLCMLSVEDDFSIEVNTDNGDKQKYHMPGAVMLEIKIPVSVLEDTKPITDEYISRVLVTSRALFDLLHVNPNLISLLGDDSPKQKREELKEKINFLLFSRGSTEPLQNLGNQIKEPNFKNTLPESGNKKRITSTIEAKKPIRDNGIHFVFLPNLKFKGDAVFTLTDNDPNDMDAIPKFFIDSPACKI
jgi:hypothetical protein